MVTVPDLTDRELDNLTSAGLRTIMKAIQISGNAIFLSFLNHIKRKIKGKDPPGFTDGF